MDISSGTPRYQAERRRKVRNPGKRFPADCGRQGPRDGRDQLVFDSVVARHAGHDAGPIPILSTSPTLLGFVNDRKFECASVVKPTKSVNPRFKDDLDVRLVQLRNLFRGRVGHDPSGYCLHDADLWRRPQIGFCDESCDPAPDPMAVATCGLC